MLVGREQEERLLDHLLEGARSGRSGVLAIVADAGIGKSALLDRAVGFGADMRVLRARGIQSEARIPFGALLELVRPALSYLDQVPRPQKEALEGALALRPARANDRFAIGAAVLALLAACSEDAPLLVLVDDVQWLDGSTADALLFAFRRLVADRIAVVLTVRSGERSLLDNSDVSVHHLEGLDRDATAALMAEHVLLHTALTDDVVDRVHRGTGGNPLAVIELAHHPSTISFGLHDGPLPIGERVARAYVERCDALPERAQEMLLLAAASDSGDLPLLAKAAATAGLDIADLGTAEAAGLVTIAADRLDFCHPLARSAVYGAAATDRRRAAHAALADALPDAEADRRAWHLALAALGPDEAASSAMEQAAARARARSAYDVSSQAYERASGLAVGDSRRSCLLYDAADAAWLGGLATRAVELLEVARRLAPPSDVALSIEHLRGHIATRRGPIAGAHQILLAGADLAATVEPDRAVVMLAEAVNASFYSADPAGMREAAARIPSAVASSTSDLAAFFAAMAQGMTLIFDGNGGDAGASMVRAAVALIVDSDALSDDPRLLAWAAMGPLWLREADAGRGLVARTLDLARRQSAVGVLPFLLSHVALDLVGADRWQEAEADFHEAIELARASEQHTDLASALAQLAWLEARQGRERECRTHTDEALTLAQSLGLGLIEIWSLAALGDLELGLGQLEVAAAHFEQLHKLLRERGIGDVDLSREPELVEADLRLGRRQQAEARLGAFARDAAAKGQPWALARAARCRGLLGPDEDVARHFEDALAWHREARDLFEMARTQLAYGSRLRRARHRVRAREQLRPALDAFERLGATPWAEMARSELGATGETARRRDVSTRDQLTPQELQVAVLLASGRTTREAAAALFLSPKTIEYHLRSIYRKLGINTREELAASLATANHVRDTATPVGANGQAAAHSVSRQATRR